jgi:hypothetical protein
VTCVVTVTFPPCVMCGAEDGWHRVGCPMQCIPTLGMGTVPGPRVSDDPDELLDCAPEGFAALDHLEPPVQEHAA